MERREMVHICSTTSAGNPQRQTLLARGQVTCCLDGKRADRIGKQTPSMWVSFSEPGGRRGWDF